MAKPTIYLNSYDLQAAFCITPRTLREWIRKEESGERNLGITEALHRKEKPRVWALTKKLHESIRVIRTAHNHPAWTPPTEPTE